MKLLEQRPHSIVVDARESSVEIKHKKGKGSWETEKFSELETASNQTLEAARNDDRLSGASFAGFVALSGFALLDLINNKYSLNANEQPLFVGSAFLASLLFISSIILEKNATENQELNSTINEAITLKTQYHERVFK